MRVARPAKRSFASLARAFKCVLVFYYVKQVLSKAEQEQEEYITRELSIFAGLYVFLIE